MGIVSYLGFAAFGGSTGGGRRWVSGTGAGLQPPSQAIALGPANHGNVSRHECLAGLLSPGLESGFSRILGLSQ